MTLSVIIPTRNEASEIGPCLQSLRQTFTGEIIVVDGDSQDGTPALLADCRLWQTRPNLALQCNEGARIARGDWLFFCAADSRPAGPWLESLHAALASPYVVGGGFALDLGDSSLMYRLISFGGNFRSRRDGIALGDQGLFVKRADYLAVGGMREESTIPYARLCFDLRKRGELVLLRDRVVSSPRLYRENGILRTVIRHVRAYSRFRRQEISSP